jgi:O-antigen/teichoic acid export membrane protein
MTSPPSTPSVRSDALKGGAFLAGRHAISLVIHLAGVSLLTRAIGAHDYGLYIGAFGVQTYLYNVGQLGVIVYLIRHGGELGDKEFNQAFTLLTIIGLSLAALVLVSLPTIEGWIGIRPFAAVGQVLVLVLPLQLLGLVPTARLERAFQYRVIAPIELAGYLTFYLVALPLAWRGWREWAPVAGYCSQQTLVALALYWRARYRPRFTWHKPLVREILAYGVSYSGASWIWQLRELVNPLIVGRTLGTSAVAYVALTVRLVEALSFLRGVGWRLALATLGKLQHDRARMLRAANDAMQMQVFALGVVLAGFGLIAPWVVPRLFGAQWSSVTALYPFVALGSLAISVFQLELAMLSVVKLNSHVAAFYATHLALFAVGSAVLLPLLGVIGYGWGEVVALAGYYMLHIQVRRAIGSPKYDLAFVWLGMFAAMLFWQSLGWLSVLAALVALLWPGTVRELKKYFSSLTNFRFADS